MEQTNRVIDIRDLLNFRNVEYDEDGFPIPYKGNISELKINCRPMTHKFEPQIYSEFTNGKQIIHNYGHAAQGWTLLFGAVQKAIKIFEQNILNQKLSLDDVKNNKEITIIGYGCMGLTTALSLNHLGYKNIKMVGEQKDLITSHVAGGGFNTVPLQNIEDEEIKRRINGMVLDSFLCYKKIFENNHPFSPFLQNCVSWMDYMTTKPDGNGLGLSYLSTIGVIDKPYLVDLIYGNKENTGLVKGKHWIYKTFVIHTERYCVNAFNYLKSLKICCELKKVNDFNELKSPIIFNCTGVNSYYLNNDKSMFPCAGHGIIIKNQDCEMNLDKFPNLCFTSLDIKELNDYECNGNTYIYPKDNCIFVGGTSINDYDGSNNLRNKDEWRKLIQRARFIFHGIIPQPPKMKVKF